jgi:hypothetical protein
LVFCTKKNLATLASTLCLVEFCSTKRFSPWSFLKFAIQLSDVAELAPAKVRDISSSLKRTSTWGRCYDQNFSEIFCQFSAKNGVFCQNQCCTINFFQKLVPNFFGENVLKSTTPFTGVEFKFGLIYKQPELALILQKANWDCF